MRLLHYNHGQKLYGHLRKTALSMTPQAMYNQFKRPSAGSCFTDNNKQSNDENEIVLMKNPFRL